MITYDNMLDAVAAHCLAYPGTRLHLTNAQLRAGKIDAERLATWADSNGLTIEEAVSRGMEGWNIVKTNACLSHGDDSASPIAPINDQ